MSNLQRVTAHIAAGVASAQGAAGVACVTAGAYRIAGLGVALIVLGTFLVLATLFASLGGGRR